MSKGFSFVEVIMALFLLSLIVLHVFNFEKIAFRATHNSYLLTLAELELNNFHEQYLAGMSVDDLNNWNSRVASLLPAGRGSYSVYPDHAEVSLCWLWDLSIKQCLTTPLTKI
jgi:prepilin-type N-terminal cleavage/methylation domain-containing protein